MFDWMKQFAVVRLKNVHDESGPEFRTKLCLEHLESRELLTLQFDPTFTRADPFCLASEYDPGHVNVIVPGEASSVVRQADGKLVLAGTAFVPSGSNFSLARVNEDGSLDSSFGPSQNGIVKVPYFDGASEAITGMTLDSAGRIIVVGHALNPVTGS
jgi:hypothetical protein